MNSLFLKKIDEDVENKNFNVLDSDKPVLFNTPLSNKVECSDPEDDIDEIDAFLAMEVSSNLEDYYDPEGDVIFLENLLSDDTTHNTSITFSPRSDPLHHEFSGELITLPSRIAREYEEYLSRMTLLCEISSSRSQENVHANPSSIIESLPVSLIPVEDSDPVQEEIDIFLVPYDLIPPGVENDDSEDEDNSTFLPENESSIREPSSPRPLLEPPDVCFNIEPDTAMKNNEDFNQGEIVLSLNVEDVNSFTFVIWTFLPFFTYPEDSPVILSLRSTDKAKTTRKWLKPGKHEHKEQKSTKEAGNSKPKSKVNQWSNLGQPRVLHHQTHLIGQYSQERPRWKKESTSEDGFYTQLTHKINTSVSITDCHAGNPCEIASDPTAKNELPIIERLYGYDRRERGKRPRG
ncbi:hypothetical protein Tco_1286992 [Tanacetum coccineum]